MAASARNSPCMRSRLRREARSSDLTAALMPTASTESSTTAKIARISTTPRCRRPGPPALSDWHDRLKGTFLPSRIAQSNADGDGHRRGAVPLRRVVAVVTLGAIVVAELEAAERGGQQLRDLRAGAQFPHRAGRDPGGAIEALNVLVGAPFIAHSDEVGERRAHLLARRPHLIRQQREARQIIGLGGELNPVEGRAALLGRRPLEV